MGNDIIVMYLNIRRYSLHSRSKHEYECRRTEYEYMTLQIRKIWEVGLEPRRSTPGFIRNIARVKNQMMTSLS